MQGPSTETESVDEMTDDRLSNADTQSFVGSYQDSCFDGPFSPGSISQTRPFSPGSVSQTPMAKKRKVSQMDTTNEILREFLDSRPKPSDFMPPKPADDVQQFFDSMASTVRKFSPLAIARIKLKIAQIVGEEEIAWAEEVARQNAPAEYIYLTQTTQETTQQSSGAILTQQQTEQVEPAVDEMEQQ